MGIYDVSIDQAKKIHSSFTYHSPNEDQIARMQEMRTTAYELAKDIVEATPVSREQSLALTHLEEVIFWANASIVRNET